ncbi:flavodoxin family protein [Jidongwangia harbinensis]|uniref:flavodoxin family protein n=1 Tax=Jidongwangia harbinensis TaxID=2878561 RepID=UPI001CDA3F0B|nr:flavodoxin [Jidongwangia harbinensis]MCA2219307.1 flavodoxin [Jidongwangia harbinensis]
MKALVVYESMFGNTAAIARAVADALGSHFEVTLAETRAVPRAIGMDLVVVGGPTHAFGMTRPGTRADAVRQGSAASADFGLREWLDGCPTLTGTPAAAFDTRMSSPLFGSAAHKAHRRLRRLGCVTVAPPQSFRVAGTSGPLLDGERERAGKWAESVAQAALAATHNA